MEQLKVFVINRIEFINNFETTFEMDPMEQAEEERRRKELFELRDMEEVVGIQTDNFLSLHDLSSKGKDVHPSGKQTKIVQTIADSLRTSNQPSRRLLGGEVEEDISDNSVCDFDLMANPRIMIFKGPVMRREPDVFLRRFSKR